MQEALNGVWVLHDSDPGTEASVGQTVAKAADRVEDNQYWKGRVNTDDNICQDVA